MQNPCVSPLPMHIGADAVGDLVLLTVTSAAFAITLELPLPEAERFASRVDAAISGARDWRPAELLQAMLDGHVLRGCP